MRRSIRLSFNVPPELREEVVRTVHAIRWRDRREKFRDLVKRLRALRIIVSDAAMSQKFGWKPIVRATTYGGVVTQRQRQAVWGPFDEYQPNAPWYVRNHPRVPVAMRGSGFVLLHWGEREHTVGDGRYWLLRVCERYLRRTR